MRREPRPCTADESVLRARRLVDLEAAAEKPHPYILSAGRYDPDHPDAPPFTRGVSEAAAARWGKTLGCDCSAFVKWCLKLPSARFGFNKGPWATVAGSINVDSLVEDARHERDLCELVSDGAPRPGDLLAWPSIRGREIGRSHDGEASKRFRVGHVALVLAVRAAEWDWSRPAYELLDVAQCGSTHEPAIHASTGAAWANRDRTRWGKRPEWASVLIRPVV
jgi:hypothetical protein